MSFADRLHARLRRITTSNLFIAEVDGLRFMAIAPVVVFHVRNYLTVHPVAAYATPPAEDWAARLTLHGHYGVQLFFIISGFVLALPFARSYLEDAPRVRLRQYLVRRLTRLEPPYVVAMVGCFLLLVLVRGDGAAGLLPHLLAGLVYQHSAIYGELNPVNLVAWSLEVEVQFYLLVPLLTTVFAVRSKFRRRALLAAAAALLLLWQATLMPAGGRVSFSLAGHLQYFLAGFVLADLYLSEMRAPPRSRALWDAVALAGWPLLLLVCEWPALAHVVFAPMALLLFCAAFRGGWTRSVLTNRWLTVVGGMCYTIYLIHFQLLSLFEKTAGGLSLTNHFGPNLLLHCVLFAPFVLLFGALYFLLIEKPCMRHDWPRRLARRASALASRRETGQVGEEELACGTAVSRASR